MMLFIATLYKGFSIVGQRIQRVDDFNPKSQFMVWALGCSLFTHALTFISVSYYDQSFVFIYVTLAAIGSVWSEKLP